jgi:hypothetical protein
MIIDTFPDFLSYWKEFKNQHVDQQINGWATRYLSPWPELLTKQVEDYTSDGFDWQEVARERIFPRVAERLLAMETAHKNLLNLIEPTVKQTKEILGFDLDIDSIIYVGIGLGAGWATTYEGNPAVLFGLENIAEEGWIEDEHLSGLIAHEVSHLVHFHGREEEGIPKGSGPLWQLYTEGFAQWCEHQVTANPFYRLSNQKKEWISWCQSNQSWLAKEFLYRVKTGESVRDFFGSWLDIMGYSQCGYYLGHEVIQSLIKNRSLHEIAVLEDYETAIYGTTRQLSQE